RQKAAEQRGRPTVVAPRLPAVALGSGRGIWSIRTSRHDRMLRGGHRFREAGVVGSNPVTPTKHSVALGGRRRRRIPAKRLFDNGLKLVAGRDSSCGCGTQRRAAGWWPFKRRRSG